MTRDELLRAAARTASERISNVLALPVGVDTMLDVRDTPAGLVRFVFEILDVAPTGMPIVVPMVTDIRTFLEDPGLSATEAAVRTRQVATWRFKAIEADG